MAALGKIRSKGVLLICIISLGLFAFIAEEAFRSCESSSNEHRQQVGEVLGEKINVTDFQKMVDEYTEVIKMQQGQENLNEDQLNQVKDMVWNTYVQTKLVENEAKRVGLTVTDSELQNVLNEGTNPMLAQTPFYNQQTGRFDANALKKFLAEYKAQSQTNPQMAQVIISQFGGPDGELSASMRYLSQRYTMPYKEVTGILTDIGTEELAHLEIVCAIVHQLTRNLSPEEIEHSGFAPYYVDHTLALWPQSAGGVPWSATTFQSKGDPITDLHEDLSAEQKARTTYDNILRLIKDPEVCDPIRFLREREIVHYQRFGESLRIVQEKLDSKNFYAVNPEFDR